MLYFTFQLFFMIALKVHTYKAKTKQQQQYRNNRKKIQLKLLLLLLLLSSCCQFEAVRVNCTTAARLTVAMCVCVYVCANNGCACLQAVRVISISA